MHQHHQVGDEGGADETARPDRAPSWMIPLEVAVFVAVTLAVTALVLIGTTYTALLLTGAAAVGLVAATRTRNRVLRRHRLRP
ncbi:hypothetical protein ABT116_22945 [Streptomyces sp. NPDC002130]|uniref:hypothetical protein n=1 Tax=Streptomyces sp. NPDC002130 TaxID=3155568 RepID=UPI003324CF00